MTSNNAASPEQETFLEEKAQKKSRWQSFKDFLKHTDAKGVTYYAGRTGKSWALITTFYIIFYACLAGFFAICMAVFMTTINPETPKWYGKGNIIGNRPGLGFQPWLLDEPDSTLIKFNPRDSKTYEKYTKRMRDFLEPYFDDTIEVDHDTNCDGADEKRTLSCSYREKIQEIFKAYTGTDVKTREDLENFNFGYNTGKPIVALTLNRLMGYTPKPYTTEELNEVEDLREDDKQRHDTDHVLVVCEGQYPADKDNIGHVAYQPRAGFPVQNFPYRKYGPKQKHWGYHQPIVFVQFDTIKKGVVVLVECRALAKNIAVDSYYKLGIAHFEVVVDDMQEM